MRRWASIVLAISTVGGAAEVSINSKVAPVVFEGTTLKFAADRAVEWSLAAGSKGTMDADGTYHAPLHVRAKQSVAGCQVLPNDHVFNTRVDGLPVHAKSSLWMHAASGGRLHYAISFPVNAITSETPTQKMKFAYTSEADGLFHVLPPSEFKMESGYYTEPFGGMDRHSIMVESDTCHFQEMYNFYPAGTNTYNNCPRCTSQSGVRYSGTSYQLPKAATDAASLFLTPLSLHRDEVLSGAINHALRVTLAGAFTQAARVWPAVAGAGYNHNDVPPFGTRFRLRSDVRVESANPYVKTLVTQLKQYGLMLADIGGQWDIDTSDVDLYFDPEIRAAFNEVARLVSPANFEVVDESGLIENPNSGETPLDTETVVAKDKASGRTQNIRVVLVGVTIGTESQYLVMQSGAPMRQLRAWVNGSRDKKVVWSMKPPIGSLTVDGVYTPPAHLKDRGELMLTAKAGADTDVSTTVKVILLPEGPIRIDNGSRTAVTDSKGNVWGSECCTPYAVTWDYSTPLWPNSKDIKLYRDDTVSWNDIPYRVYVPPGKYRVTAKMAEPTNTSPNVRLMDLESQGQLIYRDIDLFAQAGVRAPLDFNLPAEVGSDGRLDFLVRHVKGEQSLLSALQIVPDPGVPRIQVTPSDGGAIAVSRTKQFYAVAWYTPKDAVRWSISPNIGSINGQGLYTAPATPVERDTLVTVTAADGGLAAKASILVKKGAPAIRINCGGGEFTDAQGNVWEGDRGFSGGQIYDGGFAIQGAPADMQKLYQTSRYAYRTDGFSYVFPVQNGSYRVTLKWAEYRSAADVAAQGIAYKMNVTMNGNQVLSGFDPIAAAGGVTTAYDARFEVKVKNGELRIVFAGEPGAGYVGSGINGIEIEPVL